MQAQVVFTDRVVDSSGDEKSVVDKAKEYSDEFLKRCTEANKHNLKLKQNLHQSSLCSALQDIAKALEEAYSRMQALIVNNCNDAQKYIDIISVAVPHCVSMNKVGADARALISRQNAKKRSKKNKPDDVDGETRTPTDVVE